jgi:hypothetical protein
VEPVAAQFVDFEGRAKYDFIVRKDDKELEIECKAITADCGNAIHAEDLNNFGNDLLKRLRITKDMVVRVDVALADRLPSEATRKDEIAKAIAALFDGPATSALVGDTNLVLRRLAQSPIDAADVQGSALRALERIRDERNGAAVGIFSRTQFIAIHLYSERKTRVQESIADTIEHGSGQLSRTKPGILWTHFTDLTSAELDSLVEIYRGGSFTLLQGVGSKMFSDEKHNHVAALFFSGEAPVQEFGGPGSLIIHAPYYSQRGTLYPLWNKNCRLNAPFRELM